MFSGRSSKTPIEALATWLVSASAGVIMAATRTPAAMLNPTKPVSPMNTPLGSES